MDIKKLIKLQHAIIKAHQKIKDVQNDTDNQTKEIKNEFKKEFNGLNKALEQLNEELSSFTKKEDLNKQNKELERLKDTLEEVNKSIDDKISKIQLKHGKDGVNGKDGIDGKDGKNGTDGRDGKDGKDGANGLSAYEIAVNQGYEGTEEEWIEHITNNGGKDYSGQIATINQRVNNVSRIIKTNGDGDKYLSDDGTYKEVSEVPDNVLTTTSVLQTIEECEQCTGEQVPAAGLMAMTYNSIPRVVSEVENDVGYITEETDPIFTNSIAYSITQADVSKWNSIDTKVNMFHAKIDNSNFQYVKGSADFTYEDVVNTENCVIEVQVANEKVYLKKQEFKNINPPDSIAGRYVGFSEIIRVAGEMAELFLFVYDPNNLPTDEASLDRLKDWGDYQYCQSSYQPIMMGNFLGKNIADERNRDNLAPSMKAVGDYTDSQCGVVLDYMQTTFAQNIMTLVGLSYTKKPVTIYDDANGFEASNDDAGDTWHLTGLDLKPYKRLKFYVRSGGDGDANYSPAHIVEMHLDDRAKGSFGYFSADHAGHCPNNRNRHHIVTFIVNAEKTAIQFQHAISIYGTAASNSAGGRSCYLIEGYYD